MLPKDKQQIHVSSLPFPQLKLQGLIDNANGLEVWKMNLVAYSPITDVMYVAVGKKIKAYCLSNWKESLDSTIECSFELNYLIAAVGEEEVTINFLYFGSMDGMPVLGVVDSVGNVVLWNEPQKGEIILSLNNSSISSWGLATSEKHRLLAVSANDHLIKVWSIGEDFTLGNAFTLSGHHHNIPCISFSPCGAFLISTSIDGTVWIWNVATQEPIYSTDVSPERDWGWSCLPVSLAQLALDEDCDSENKRFVPHAEEQDTGWVVPERHTENEQSFITMNQHLERDYTQSPLIDSRQDNERSYGVLQSEHYDSIMNDSMNAEDSHDLPSDDEADWSYSSGLDNNETGNASSSSFSDDQFVTDQFPNDQFPENEITLTQNNIEFTNKPHDSDLQNPSPIDYIVFATSHSSLALFAPPRRQSVIYRSDYITTSLSPRQRRLLTPLTLRTINRLHISLWIGEISCLLTASHCGLATLSRVSRNATNGLISLSALHSFPLDDALNGEITPSAIPTCLMAGLCVRANSPTSNSLGLPEGQFQLFVVHIDGTVAAYEIGTGDVHKCEYLFI